MSHQWYLGFGASESLYQLNNDYRAALASVGEKEQTEKLYNLLAQFADECLDQYFLSPIESVQLNGMGKKVVLGGVSAIKKTIHLTLKQVTKKLSAKDRAQLADYINGLMMQLRQSRRFPTYVAVPVSGELRSRLGTAVQQGREQSPAAVKDDYAEALCELIDVAVDAYMHEPIRMLKMGLVMNKVASVAADTIQGAAHTVVRKVVHSMSDKELIPMFEFSESILYQPQQQAA
ncbi:MAG TPA: hypothetical protein VM553_19445 [Dongiaceae bacterium]|nr:hypothetical protein [Dongiaceae bacterium]